MACYRDDLVKVTVVKRLYDKNAFVFFFSSRRRHTRFDCDWSSDVCSSDLPAHPGRAPPRRPGACESHGRADSAVDGRRARLVRRPGRDHHGARGSLGRGACRPSGPARPARSRGLLRPDAQEAALGRPLRPRAHVVLAELRVRDLAVISDVTLPLSPGLNVLTGETGAGKSLLVDALALRSEEHTSE